MLLFLALCVIFHHSALLKSVSHNFSVTDFLLSIFSSSFALHLIPLLLYLFPDFLPTHITELIVAYLNGKKILAAGRVNWLPTNI